VAHEVPDCPIAALLRVPTHLAPKFAPLKAKHDFVEAAAFKPAARFEMPFEVVVVLPVPGYQAAQVTPVPHFVH
jgi:hypothetical protein